MTLKIRKRMLERKSRRRSSRKSKRRKRNLMIKKTMWMT